MMTRFHRELRGDLGAFWQQHAQDELTKVKADLDGDKITIDEAGVAWNCIGRALMDDLLDAGDADDGHRQGRQRRHTGRT